MADMLRSSLDILSRLVSSKRGVPVTYQRGATSLTISATTGRTVFRYSDADGVSVREVSADFLFLCEGAWSGAIMGVPVAGDTITDADGRVFMVTKFNGEPCFRWTNSSHVAFRVHTSQMGGPA